MTSHSRRKSEIGFSRVYTRFRRTSFVRQHTVRRARRSIKTLIDAIKTAARWWLRGPRRYLLSASTRHNYSSRRDSITHEPSRSRQWLAVAFGILIAATHETHSVRTILTNESHRTWDAVWNILYYSLSETAGWEVLL